MLTISFRALGVLLSGAALVGWLAGSVLSPPAAVTQAPPRPGTGPIVRPTLPRLAWPATIRAVARPVPSRNPFTFRASPPSASEAPRVPAAARELAATEAAEAEVSTAASDTGSHWRLSGIAASGNGEVVAVIAGGGDVHLMRAGDTLPGGDGVVEVGLDHVVIRTANNVVTLRLP